MVGGWCRPHSTTFFFPSLGAERSQAGLRRAPCAMVVGRRRVFMMSGTAELPSVTMSIGKIPLRPWIALAGGQCCTCAVPDFSAVPEVGPFSGKTHSGAK